MDSVRTFAPPAARLSAFRGDTPVTGSAGEFAVRVPVDMGAFKPPSKRPSTGSSSDTEGESGSFSFAAAPKGIAGSAPAANTLGASEPEVDTAEVAPTTGFTPGGRFSGTTAGAADTGISGSVPAALPSWRRPGLMAVDCLPARAAAAVPVERRATSFAAGRGVAS
jgi:hypothetical protein